MAILNLRMMSHPMNWLTIVLMALIAGVAGHLFLTFIGLQPATKGNGNGKHSAWETMPAGQALGEARAGAIAPQMAPIAINSIR